MKSVLNQEFETARNDLLEAAVADAALKHLRSLRAMCEALLDLLEAIPPEMTKTASRVRCNPR